MCGTCASLVADLFFLFFCFVFVFCYERDFIMSFIGNEGAVIIESFNLKSKYLDNLLN